MAVAVVLSGCAGSNGDQEPDATPTTTPSTSPVTTPDEPGTKTSACEDKRGDGGPMDLLLTTLTVGEDVVVTAELAEAIPRDDTVDVGVMLLSQDWNTSQYLVGRWVNGRALGPRNRGMLNSGRIPPARVLVEGSTVTLTYPPSVLDGLGENWTWGAWTGADSIFRDASGNNVDACPGPVGAMERQPF